MVAGRKRKTSGLPGEAVLTVCTALVLGTPLSLGAPDAQSTSTVRSVASPLAGFRNLPAMIVFNSNRGGNHELYMMREDGTGVTRLTDDARFDSWWARVTPDRARLLFYRTPKSRHKEDYTQTSLWLLKADAAAPVQLRAAGADGWAMQGHGEWAPDGKHIVMFGGPERKSPQIYVTDDLGQAPHPITRRPGENFDPSWSPDGRRILFVGCPAGHYGVQDYEVYDVPADGSSAPRRLTFDRLRDHDPYFSPDGRTIAWLTQTSNFLLIGTWGIRCAPYAQAPWTNSAALRWVIDDHHISSYPAWSADGSQLFFHRLVFGGRPFNIYAIHPDGTGLKELTAGAPGVSEYPAVSAPLAKPDTR